MKTELGNPVSLPQWGRQLVRGAVEDAGTGEQKKRKPACNELDRKPTCFQRKRGPRLLGL
ncbi:hypothetical protein EEJ37_17800 [Vibrio cholerae]|nr:hypothetical protein EEJ37_17800 [Vibrio cholerae]